MKNEMLCGWFHSFLLGFASRALQSVFKKPISRFAAGPPAAYFVLVNGCRLVN